MSRVSAVRRLQFCAGHRVHRHESKCRHLHGHNYVAFFHAEAEDGLDALGRVIDFGVLKSRLMPWLESNWDHGMIVWREDVEAIAALRAVGEQKLFLLEANPTAENMALHLLHEVGPRVLEGTGVTIRKVVLWETENCYTEAELALGESPRPTLASGGALDAGR
jgi:6-pyruvoyltetrahydropterin/6-carboxytetrahydropterin synthase